MNKHLATVNNQPTKIYLQASFDDNLPPTPHYVIVFWLLSNCPAFTAFCSIQWS